MWALGSLLSLAFAGICTSANRLGARTIKSSFVCENDIWNVECPGASVLLIDTVDYEVVTGPDICNRNNSVLSAPCTPVDKTSQLESRCNDEQKCSVPAEKSIFGIPCSGSNNSTIYLLIFYECVEPPATSPTARPRNESSTRKTTSKTTTTTPTTLSEKSSPDSATTEKAVHVKSPVPRSGQTTTTKYRKPQPCTTPPKREILTFNPDNEPAINEASSLLPCSQNVPVVFWSTLLLAMCHFLI